MECPAGCRPAAVRVRAHANGPRQDRRAMRMHRRVRASRPRDASRVLPEIPLPLSILLHTLTQHDRVSVGCNTEQLFRFETCRAAVRLVAKSQRMVALLRPFGTTWRTTTAKRFSQAPT